MLQVRQTRVCKQPHLKAVVGANSLPSHSICLLDLQRRGGETAAAGTTWPGVRATAANQGLGRASHRRDTQLPVRCGAVSRSGRARKCTEHLIPRLWALFLLGEARSSFGGRRRDGRRWADPGHACDRHRVYNGCRHSGILRRQSAFGGRPRGALGGSPARLPSKLGIPTAGAVTPRKHTRTQNTFQTVLIPNDGPPNCGGS